MLEKSIFLAESEHHVREALRLMIQHQAGWVLAGEANHAEGLLAQVCGRPPDIILLDWHLPGLHRQRLIATLRQHCPTTCILATSARPEQEKVALALGIDAFLLKQLPPDQFVSALQKTIDDTFGQSPSSSK